MGLVTWEFGDKGIRRKQRSGAFWEGRYEATMVDSGDRQSAVPCLASFARLSHTGGCMVPGPLTKNWLLAGPALLASAALALLAMAVATASAAPGRTYTVQFTDALESAPWRKLFDVPARTTNYLHLLPDAGTNRFYRLVTPQQPADFGF